MKIKELKRMVEKKIADAASANRKDGDRSDTNGELTTPAEDTLGDDAERDYEEDTNGGDHGEYDDDHINDNYS
jgi:hypothetical protein